jgi:chromosome segregation ATPase
MLIAFTARHLQNRKQAKIKKIREEQKNIQAEFDSLKNNLHELTAQKNELQSRLTEAKTRKISESQKEEESKKQKSTVDILRENEQVTETQLKKATHYLEDNQPNMELEDVLVMFGYITPEQLKKAQDQKD